jgi:hypothetical protein
MEIESFREVTEIIALAKELRDMGRYDIVENNFSDILSCDSWSENMYGAITSVFSGFSAGYDEGNETETFVFTDDVIGEYYRPAPEYGRRHNVPHDMNPFVTEAEREARRLLNFCGAADFKLLGYTRTEKAAKRSKLIVRICMCDCDCHGRLAYGLVRLYGWFSDKVAESKKQTGVTAA